MVINGNFDGYIRQIPFRDTPGRPVDQLLFLPYGPKCPILGPKFGPKRSKMAQITVLLLYCLIFCHRLCTKSILVSIVDTWKCAQEPNGIIVGSRFLDQSSISGFPVYRLWLSRILNAILKLTTRNKTSDPLSGFFLAPITVISSTNTNGFKILYDLLLRSQDNPCMDVPIAFSGRIGGKSKARLFELVELLKILSMSFARQR